MLIRESFHEKDITILNVHTPNDRTQETRMNRTGNRKIYNSKYQHFSVDHGATREK